MRVLALDLANNSGVAIVDGDATLVCTSWPLLDGVRTSGRSAPPLDVRHVLAVQSLRNRLKRLISIHRPDVVAVEREFGRGVGSRLLVALYTAGQEAAYDAGLPCLGVRLGDWRKHVHGSGGWTTDRYKDEAMRLVPDAPDADAAEATLIARYVAQTARSISADAPSAKRQRKAA